MPNARYGLRSQLDIHGDDGTPEWWEVIETVGRGMPHIVSRHDTLEDAQLAIFRLESPKAVELIERRAQDKERAQCIKEVSDEENRLAQRGEYKKANRLGAALKILVDNRGW